MQRFDFVMRERMLDEKEAALFAAVLARQNSGESPYRLAALMGLKALTGEDRRGRRVAELGCRQAMSRGHAPIANKGTPKRTRHSWIPGNMTLDSLETLVKRVGQSDPDAEPHP
jgi:hypothetical protein